MREYEIKNKEGLLVTATFHNAFDTMEWSFISNSLELLIFVDNIIKMLKFLQNWTKWLLLTYVDSRKGIWAPTSPYLFVLSAEILAKVIREYDEVMGLQVSGIETKGYWTFADG